MLQIALLCAAALAVVALFPDTPVAKTLLGWLIEEPCRHIARLTLRRLVFACFVALILFVLLEVPIMSGIPADLGFVLAGDAATYLELATIALMAAATVRVSIVIRQSAHLAKRLIEAARRLAPARSSHGKARRAPSTPKRRTPRRTPRRDDKEAPAGLGLAFA